MTPRTCRRCQAVVFGESCDDCRALDELYRGRPLAKVRRLRALRRRHRGIRRQRTALTG